MEYRLNKIAVVAILSTLTVGINLNANGLSLLTPEIVNRDAKEIALGAHLGLSEEQYAKFSEYMSNSVELYQNLGLVPFIDLAEYSEYSYYVRKHLSVATVEGENRLIYTPDSEDEKYLKELMKVITKHMEENEKILAEYVGISRPELQLMKSRYIDFLVVLNTYDDALSGKSNISLLSGRVTDCSPTNAMNCVTEAPDYIDPFSDYYKPHRAIFAATVFNELGLGGRIEPDYIKIEFGGYVQTWGKNVRSSIAGCYSGCSQPTGTPP